MLGEFVYDKPSIVTEVPFVHAVRETRDYPEPTERSGKWLFYVSPDVVDEVWARVAAATVEGRLGSSSKVSTAWPNPRLRSPLKARVICVYTYDYDDEDDVKRVRESLRKIGIDWPIPYRAEADTCVNTCRGKGPTAFDRYFE